ncbi:TIGR04219 family outer membrane beta-barrel protein [Gallaecimonas kandeliae]|uniref:TIGR04219 family outer membrane beta-barrel protein n=1 Tax=Gallaecimonas kandeliae TaxID=3029055 RepID=UPI0026476EAC|nr:TIGR04219 family outer membrane beta-barrel protein [Gallaecimonas kandeliae]WKE66268.1 TIGR04219 family outer membrane beta-barrel protein [Gallaecimonas kandeliae]
MKKILLATALLGSLSVPAFADNVGIYAGIGQWQNNFSGNLLSEQVSVKDELGLKSADLTQWYVNIEHPVPVLPNLRLAYSNISESGNGQLTQNVDFDGNTYPAGTQIGSDLQIKMTDATFYYELWDTGGDLDLGLTARRMNGHARLSNDLVGSGEEKVDQWVPLVYVNARIDLPMTGFYAGAQGNGITYSGNRLTDFSAFVGYDFDITGPVDVGVQLGYRALELKLKDIGDFDADVKLDGAFANVTMHF